MAEKFPHAHLPIPRRSLVQRVTLEIHRRVSGLTTLAFVGGSAVLGVESFNVIIALWPLYPAAVPLLLIGCATVFVITGAIRGRTNDPALTFRSSRLHVDRRRR